jgi:hypothetical protein
MSDVPPAKRARPDDDTDRTDGDADRDALIAKLSHEIEQLRDREGSYYSSNDCVSGLHTRGLIPEYGNSARHAKERIVQMHELGKRVRDESDSGLSALGLLTNHCD